MNQHRSPSGPEAGSVTFLGLRYHACVPLAFVGLGIVVGDGIRGASKAGEPWAAVVGLLFFFVGSAWWIGLWRRSARPPA